MFLSGLGRKKNNIQKRNIYTQVADKHALIQVQPIFNRLLIFHTLCIKNQKVLRTCTDKPYKITLLKCSSI